MSPPNNGQGPPDHSNARKHVKQRDDGTVGVSKRPEEQRSEEIQTLRDSVDWSNAPDWARLLHLEIEQMNDS